MFLFQNCPDSVIRVSSLLLLVCLLPQTPLVTSHDLQDLFCIYRKSAEFLHRHLYSPTKSEQSVREANSADNLRKMYSVHLRLALDAYFQRLYGIFPCNFLTYLRFVTLRHSYCIFPSCMHHRILFGK